MFAGIVEAVGRVVRVGPSPRAAAVAAPARRLDVEAPGLLAELALGASVAVNGVCLTLTERGPGGGSFEVVPETWHNTNLRGLRAGDAVNLERSLRLGDRIDGHFVQGHVDGVGTVERVERAGGEWKLWVTAAEQLLPAIVPKGSVALDGVSLTVVDVAQTRFSVVLIPTTLERTVLGRRPAGALVNIETDILARLVLSRLAALGLGAADGPGRPGLTLERLRADGFA